MERKCRYHQVLRIYPKTCTQLIVKAPGYCEVLSKWHISFIQVASSATCRTIIKRMKLHDQTSLWIQPLYGIYVVPDNPNRERKKLMFPSRKERNHNWFLPNCLILPIASHIRKPSTKHFLHSTIQNTIRLCFSYCASNKLHML